MQLSYPARMLCAAAVLNLGLASMAVATVTISYVPVGDPGNVGDVQTQGTFGAVANPYRISSYDVTNAQYVEFLNTKDATGVNALGLYNSSMTTNQVGGGINFNASAIAGSKYAAKSGQDNKPVAWVGFYDSIRFANWLNNGQGSGSTETGSYTLLGGTPTPTNGGTLTRNANAGVVLPSENEWYKAAYYKGGNANAGYWKYATQSDTVPSWSAPPGSTASNSANYVSAGGYAMTGSTVLDTSQNYLSDVGAYVASVSAYGTFDQSGDVFQWNEALIGTARGGRGGAWDGGTDVLSSAARLSGGDTSHYQNTGFRVASVPEPTGIAAGRQALFPWHGVHRFLYL